MSGVIRGEAISDPGGILQSPIDPDYVRLHSSYSDFFATFFLTRFY